MFFSKRCFEELGYKCANAYYMPCTPNYNAQGRPIPGQENSCPENFSCETIRFKDGPARACLPNEPDVPWSEHCKTDFDCGYSTLENRWSRCYDGRCVRAVE